MSSLRSDARGVRRSDPHDREVGRAAADIGHQHDLLGVQAAFVVERSGDRLVLELDLVEADLARGGLERGLRLRVAHRIVVDEEHRPAEHGAVDRRADPRLGAGLEVHQVTGHDVEILDAAT